MSVIRMPRAQRGVGIGDRDFSSIDMCLRMVGNDKFSETGWGEKKKSPNLKNNSIERWSA